MMVYRKRDLDRAHAEHDRNVDPDAPERDDDLYVPSRAEDRSVWWLTSYYMQKFAILWVPIVWFLTQLGFRVYTPSNNANEIKEQLVAATATLQRQIDSLRVAQLKFSERSESNERALTVLVRQACINRSVSQYDKQMIGLIDAHGDCIR